VARRLDRLLADAEQQGRVVLVLDVVSRPGVVHAATRVLRDEKLNIEGLAVTTEHHDGVETVTVWFTLAHAGEGGGVATIAARLRAMPGDDVI
jgi:glycine cleavage system regulatory protein